MDVNNSTTLGNIKVVMLKGERGETGYGALTASTAAAMVDKSQVYVYVGNENGYTFGDWYFWGGSAWVSGGVYNAVALPNEVVLATYAVPNNTDLDTVKTNSMRALRGDFVYQNAPSTLSPVVGYMLTFKYQGVDNYIQIIFSRAGRIFTRFYANNAWSAWNDNLDGSLTKQYCAADAKAVGDAFATINTELETIGGLLALAPKNSGVLDDGGNLDDLLSSSLPYSLNPTSIYALRGDYTYSNAPESAGYVLTIKLLLTGSDGGMQIFFARRGKIYSRSKIGGVWTAWDGGIDASLTTQYSAADAKAVGDRLDALEARIAALET